MLHEPRASDPRLGPHVDYVVRTRPDAMWLPNGLPPVATWPSDVVSARARGYVGGEPVTGVKLVGRPFSCGTQWFMEECLVIDDQVALDRL